MKIVRLKFWIIIWQIILLHSIMGQSLPQGYEVRYHGPLRYGLFIPTLQDTTQRCPLVLYLHGHTDTTSWNHGWYQEEFQETNPCFVVTPKTMPNFGSWGNSWELQYTEPMRLAMEVVDMVIEDFPIDTNRLYINGASMGGFGTFNVLAKEPGRFAGAYAICGGGDPATAAAVAQTPLWIFHGSEDGSVPVTLSRDIYNAMINIGAEHVRYTEYPGVGHSSWIQAGREISLQPWLFAQDKSYVSDPPDVLEYFSAVSTGKWSNKVSWQPPADTTKIDNQPWFYELFRDNQLIATLDCIDTCFIDNNLEEQRSYDYEIQMKNYYFKSALSDPVSVQTILDTVPPKLVLCEVFDVNTSEAQILIGFDEMMDRTSCEDINNYNISDSVSILGAVLWPDKRNVLLHTTELEMDTPYVLTVSGVCDSSLSNNAIVEGTQITFERKLWLTSHIGTWENPGMMQQTDESITFNMAGNYTSSMTSDKIIFAHQQLEGDCTIMTRINLIEASDCEFQAGIMFRNNITPGSPLYGLAIDSSQVLRINRNRQDGTRFVNNAQTGITSPLFLKINRLNGYFTAYTSSDGINWGEPVDDRRDRLDSAVKLGFFATPLDSGNIIVKFDEINISSLTAISKEQTHTTQPTFLNLEAYPNPFNSQVRITCEWQLADQQKTPLDLQIYNILGQRIYHTILETQDIKKQEIIWNGQNMDGHQVTSGIYFIMLKAGTRIKIKKLVFQK